MAASTERVEPGESEEEVEDVYEVERIIDMRVEEGEVLYRVRWKNYCSDDDTWEPEAHLEDCREVLLAFKKNIAEAKSKKEAEAKSKKEAEAKKSVKVLPAKSDLLNADSDSNSDKDHPTDPPVKKKKKQHVEEPPPKERKKKKKKKERHQDDFRPLPAPETDEEDEPTTTPPSSPKKRLTHSDEDEQDPVPAKKHKKDKGKEALKTKPKAEEVKKKKGRKEMKMDTSDDDTAPIEEDISESPSETPAEDTSSDALRTTQNIYLDDKFKEKKGKWEVKLQGFKNLIQKKEAKKLDASPKESSLQKLKSLTSKAKEDLAPHSSDSSDSSTAHRKSKSKDRAPTPSSVPATPSTRSKEEKPKEDRPKDERPKEDRPKEDRPKEDRPKEDRPKEDRPKEDRPKEDRPKEDRPKEDRPKEDRPKEDRPKEERPREERPKEERPKEERPKEDRPKEDRPKEERPKEDTLAQKDATGSTNLFEKFLLNCEAKDRAPRRPAPPLEKSASKPSRYCTLIGKIEKISKSKESPVQKADADRTDKLKQTDAVSKAGQSHGFSLDSDEREGEFSPKSRSGDEARKERPDEGQRSGWDRHCSTARRREDSEPRLFMACEEEDLSEPSDKTEKTQATLSLGMDLNLDWMTLEDFQRHLNGDDEVLSGPPLSPSELRDAVKSGDYLAVKLALNSKEDYNLDQEGHAVGLKNHHRVTAKSSVSKTAVGSSACAHNTSEPLSKPNVRDKSNTNVNEAAQLLSLKKNTAASTANHTRLPSGTTDVACAVQAPKASTITLTLGQIHKGDGQHLCMVPTSGEVENKPKSQANQTSPAFSNAHELWEHKQLDKTVNGSVHCPVSQQFLTGEQEEILHMMKQDHVSRHIQKDTLICKYGKALLAKHPHNKSHFPSVAQSMRELGRFVLAVNELDGSVQCLQDIFLPTRFELAVEGAKKTIGFDTSSSTCKTSSLVSRMGSSLKGAADIALKGNQMKDCETEHEVQTFIDLLDAKWSTAFSPCTAAPASEELQEVVDKSTLTTDLVKLHLFISQEEEEARKDILLHPTLSTWKKLSEATLADVCLFNRIRVGNIGRLLLETYTCKRSTGQFVPSADQIRKSTKLELELGEQLTRLELEGQFGRSMLVVLTQRVSSLIDLLIECRDQVGVSQNNLYLFARTEGPSFIRGLDCLRRAAVECGVSNPEALLCPSLRQQIAASWQLLSLCDSDLGRVSKLLGRCKQECSHLSQNTALLEELSKQLLQMNRVMPSSTTASLKEGVQSKSAVKRRPWSEQEQAAVKRFLSEFIMKMKVPGKKECNACLAAEPDLCRRSWTDIKNFVHNTLQTLKRRQNQPEKAKPERTVVKPKRPKTVSSSSRKQWEVNNNIQPYVTPHLEESETAPSHRTEQAMLFPADLPYVSFCSANSDISHNSPTCSFSSLSVLDTQVVPTYTQLGTTNTAIHPLYSPESRYLTPLSPSDPHTPASVAMPFVDLPLDTEPPVSPALTSLNCPTTSMPPTYTTLSTAVFHPYSTMNDRNDFPPLDHTSTFFTSTTPLTPIACSQVVPSEEGMSASSDHTSSLVYSQHFSAQKRSPKLAEEEDSMRKQLADFALVKVPGKREPEEHRDTVVMEPYTQPLHNEWDPPSTCLCKCLFYDNISQVLS